MAHWNVEQVLTVGIVTWIWNHLGIEKPGVVIAGNILAAIALIVFAFFVK